jgi:hypothetical protein
MVFLGSRVVRFDKSVSPTSQEFGTIRDPSSSQFPNKPSVVLSKVPTGNLETFIMSRAAWIDTRIRKPFPFTKHVFDLATFRFERIEEPTHSKSVNVFLQRRGVATSRWPKKRWQRIEIAHSIKDSL